MSRRVRHGRDALLETPFQADVLLRTVRDVLDQGLAPARRGAATVRLMRCLACDTVYGQPERRELPSTGCPRCGYIGWARAG